MADQEQQQPQKSNYEQRRKRDSTEDEPIPNKRCRSSANGQSLQTQNNDEKSTDAATEKPAAAITNIYYDCLERIFDFLDLKSLLNVAGTCKRLQIAAAAKFSDEYGTKRIVVASKDEYIHPIANLTVQHNEIQITGLKFCLPFLRCFGGKILDLCFISSLSNSSQEYLQRKRHMQQYISEYCADTLVSFSFHGEREIQMENFSKPLKNVAKLDICSHLLPNGLPNIVHIFPNLRHLTIIFMAYDTDNNSNSALHLPHLDHLTVRAFLLDICHISYLLKANHQLQSLEISTPRSINGMNSLFDMMKGMATLSKLVIKTVVENVDTNDLLRLASEHPLLAEVQFERFQLTADNVIAFIRQLNTLKRFQFQVKDDSQYDRLRNQLGGDSEWQIEYQQNKHQVILKR